MANYNWGFDYPMAACGDADTWQYSFVKQSGAGPTVPTFQICATASGPCPIGVLQDDPESGNIGAVRILGTTKVKANATAGAINIGDFLACSSDGQAEVSAGCSIAGIAMEALASGACTLIEMLLVPYGGANKTENTP